MTELYCHYGVQFHYPSDWELTEQKTYENVTITAASAETSFWSLMLLFDRPDPELVIEKAVDAFRDEYSEIDVYPATSELCHRPTEARDVEFVCLEMLNSAFLRAFQTEKFTAFVLYQATDRELEETRGTLEAIEASLQYDEELAGE